MFRALIVSYFLRDWDLWGPLVLCLLLGILLSIDVSSHFLENPSIASLVPLGANWTITRRVLYCCRYHSCRFARGNSASKGK